MARRQAGAENHLLTVVSISFVLGMAVAIGIYLAWRSGTIAPAFHTALSILSLCVCPPFVLSFAVGPSPEAGLALTLIVGTIVFANGFLYAGVSAAGYFLVTVMRKRESRS